MSPEERRQFVRQHRTCVYGFNRKSGPPSMTVVYYVVDDNDDILVCTMAARAKAKAATRTGEASICVLDEKWPVTYLVVYGTAKIDRDFDKTVDVMMKVAAIMAGEELHPDARPLVEYKAKEEDRLLIRVTPEKTFHSPPVHLQSANLDEAGDMSHGLGATMPWNA